jgi:protein-L-isoaspartate(D-aspartate) O-methyltransferase
MAHRSDKDAFAAERDALIREIEAQVRKFGTGAGDFALDPNVLAALRNVPREQFLPDMETPEAYANQPLPIGHGQTISQPLIVALMTHHLGLGPDHTVLEIGTGSGYQTAVLAEIASDITTIENVAPLARMAKATLERLGYGGVRFMEGDGRFGSPENAPFDRIIVTAAAETLPEALVDQLAPNGRLVAPIGPKGLQEMVLVSKSRDGEIRKKVLFPCAFVPLI